MEFHLVNPYDPAIIDAPNPAVAVAAAMAMGGTRFLIRDSDTGRTWPNGETPDTWFEQETGLLFAAFLEGNRAAVVTALESVRLVGSRSSSVVDVAGRARFYARGLRQAFQEFPNKRSLILPEPHRFQQCFCFCSSLKRIHRFRRDMDQDRLESLPRHLCSLPRPRG